MFKRRGIWLLALGVAVALAAQNAPKSKTARRAPGTYAIFQTSLGSIVCKLLTEDTPETVANFIGLAEGSKEWIDPRTGDKKVKLPFYNGTTFHRVYPKFMIQGGDPLENGKGGPGYKLADEIVASLKFDVP